MAQRYCLSPADSQQPHQIINSSDEELTYLALSREEVADVMPYSGPENMAYRMGRREIREPQIVSCFLDAKKQPWNTGAGNATRREPVSRKLLGNYRIMNKAVSP